MTSSKNLRLRQRKNSQIDSYMMNNNYTQELKLPHENYYQMWNALQVLEKAPVDGLSSRNTRKLSPVKQQHTRLSAHENICSLKNINAHNNPNNLVLQTPNKDGNTRPTHRTQKSYSAYKDRGVSIDYNKKKKE